MPARTDAGIEWRWPGEPGYFAAHNDPKNDDLSRVIIFRDVTRDAGFYHLTRRTEQFYVRSHGLSTEEEQAILGAILIAIEQSTKYKLQYDVVPDMIRAGVRKQTFPIYSGYYHNAWAAAAALAFVFGSMCGRPWEWFREPRLGFYSRYSLQERRLMRGECGLCGYDLTGLSTGRCPECGSGTDGSTEPDEHPA